MSYIYRYRRDSFHVLYKHSFARAGYSCIDTHTLGGGSPDLIVIAKSGIMVWLEIKTPGGKLSDRQKEFHEEFHAIAAPIHIVDTIRDARRIVQFYDNQSISLWRKSE